MIYKYIKYEIYYAWLSFPIFLAIHKFCSYWSKADLMYIQKVSAYNRIKPKYLHESLYKPCNRLNRILIEKIFKIMLFTASTFGVIKGKDVLTGVTVLAFLIPY